MQIDRHFIVEQIVFPSAVTIAMVVVVILLAYVMTGPASNTWDDTLQRRHGRDKEKYPVPYRVIVPAILIGILGLVVHFYTLFN